MNAGFTAKHWRVSTQDVDNALAKVSNLYGETTAHCEGPFEWRANVVSLGPMLVVEGDTNAVTYLKTAVTRHTISMARAHATEIQARSAYLRLVPGIGGAIISPGQMVAMTHAPAGSLRNLVIEPAFLNAQLEALTGEVLKTGIDFDSTTSVSGPLGAYLNQGCHYIVAELERCPDHVPAALVSNLCEGFARALLTSHSHNHSYLLDKPAPPSSRSIVRIVEEFVDAHAGGPITASDLAQVAGASVLSIESAFAHHRQTSPMAFLRRRRLERVRRLLLGGQQLSMDRVAHMAGFLRREPFESAYFKLFKESPVDSRRRGFVGSNSSMPAASAETPEDRWAMLSSREREVCALVAKGRLNKQIADELGISAKTVEVHRARALTKLGLESAAELGAFWERLKK